LVLSANWSVSRLQCRQLNKLSSTIERGEREGEGEVHQYLFALVHYNFISPNLLVRDVI